jgi:lipopolysaccharide transport system permease protein
MIKETLLRANQPWWQIKGRELWAYRDLLWFLVRRDFTAIYTQSILGPLWFVIQPLATTLVFTVIFGHVAKIGTDGVPPFLFYLSGITLWNYFQSCFNAVATALMDNAHVFGKVYFPRLVVPLALTLSNLGQLAINLALYVMFWIYFGVCTTTPLRFSWAMLALPALVLHTAAVGLGSGLWLAAMTAKYRDLRFALPFLAQIWMFVTPIVYSASVVAPQHRWVLALNPMAGVVDFNRYAFLGTPVMDPALYGIGGVVGLLLLASGLLIFNKIQRTFVDTI